MFLTKDGVKYGLNLGYGFVRRIYVAPSTTMKLLYPSLLVSLDREFCREYWLESEKLIKQERHPRRVTEENLGWTGLGAGDHLHSLLSSLLRAWIQRQRSKLPFALRVTVAIPSISR